MKRRDLLIAGLGAWGLKGAEMRANLPGGRGKNGDGAGASTRLYSRGESPDCRRLRCP